MIDLIMRETPILVVAGIIERDGRVLICQRSRSDAYGLQWEFPGGKALAGETLQAALERELEEELGIHAEVREEVYRVRHRYPDRYVEVVFFRVPRYQNDLINRVFEDVRWCSRGDLPSYNFLEGDRELVARLSAGEIT